MNISLRLGDCMDVLAGMDNESIDAVICDPPYDLTSGGSKGFMGKEWDGTGIAFNSDLWKQIHRVLRPGGIVKAFSGTRTYHRMVSAMERAGFTVIPFEAWGYGCLDAQSECLTRDGWAPHTALSTVTEVLQWDPETKQLSWTRPSEIHQHLHVGTMVCLGVEEPLNKTGTWTPWQLLTPDHRVYARFNYYSRNSNSAWTVIQARDLPYGSNHREGFWTPAVHVPDLPEAHDIFVQRALHAQGVPQDYVVRLPDVVYSGVVWCVTVPTGAFVARRNGRAFITGNSGFPKSLNIGKALDAMLGAERENKKVSYTGDALLRSGGQNTRPWMEEALKKGYHELPGDTPVTDEAKIWNGWGTALKPAWEPVIVVRKV